MPFLFLEMKRILLLPFYSIYFTKLAAQPDPSNLGFENRSPRIEFSPWYTTRFSNPNYLFTLDSQTVHQGKYSLRITADSSPKANSDGGFHNVVQLDVPGSKISLSAYAKRSDPGDSSGYMSFLFSEDKGEKKTIIKSLNLKLDREWKELKTDVDISELHWPIDHLRINIVAKSRDTIWLDDLKIMVNGINMLSQPSFASRKEEPITKLTKRQTDNLLFLCHVWGFLKYFHPAVADGKYNWDMELFRIYPSIKNAEDGSGLNKILFQWIKGLGALPDCRNCSDELPENAFKNNVDLKWLDSGEISDSLRAQLKEIVKKRHKGPGYYAMYAPARNVLCSNENDYNWREIDYPSEVFRMQFLFRYWNTIQYFYPYKYLIGTDWNEVLRNFIPRFAEAPTPVAYSLIRAELIVSVNDSHAGSVDPAVYKELAAFRLPARVTVIDDKAVISRLFNDSLARIDGLKIGDAIIKVDGKSIRSIIEERSRYINGSNRPAKIRSLAGTGLLTGGKDSIVHLEMERNGRTVHIPAHRYSNYSNDIMKHYRAWKILDANIGFIDMGMLEKQQVDSAFSDLRDTRAIIFDIRNYPQGTFVDVCAYLLEKPAYFAKVLMPDLDYPGTFVWAKNLSMVGKGDKGKNYFHYPGKIVLLVNETTQSHAEFTAMALQTVPGAITIGSQTSGADGNVSNLILHGYLTYMTGLGIYYPDGTETQRVGIKIDIHVKPTQKGIIENRDEVLEKAIDWILNQHK